MCVVLVSMQQFFIKHFTNVTHMPCKWPFCCAPY